MRRELVLMNTMGWQLKGACLIGATLVRSGRRVDGSSGKPACFASSYDSVVPSHSVRGNAPLTQAEQTGA
jgi:hypothetical protein